MICQSIMKSIVAIAIVFCFIATSMSALAAPLRPPPTYSIYGYVSDAGQSGKYISNAQVIVGGVSTTTNTAGYYSVSGLDIGRYTVTVSKTGFNGQSSNVQISSGSMRKDFSLARLNGLSGYVYDLGSNVISGATVNAMLPPYGVYNSATSDSNGFYYIPPKNPYDQVAVRPLAVKAGYWVNVAGWNEVSYTSSTTQDFHLKTNSVQEIILAAVYVNRNGINDGSITIPNAQCSYATSYSVTTSWSGQAIFGYGQSTTLSVGSDLILNQAIDSSHTGLEIYGTVEITGVTQGWPGNDYQEINTYVVPGSLHGGSRLTSTTDSMADPRTDWNYVGPGITGHTIGGSETSTISTTNNYNIQTQLAGQPVTLTVTRSTTTTYLTDCQLTLSNTDPTKTLKADFKFESADPSNNVLIMHVWYDSYR